MLTFYMSGAFQNFRPLLFCAMLAFASAALAQPSPVLSWITNSSVKLEQIIGDADWANGSNTTSRTITRFNIEETDVSSSFVCGTNRIFYQYPYSTPASALDDNVLTLTDGASSGARSIFFDNPQYISAFKASFVYKAAGNKTANGASFCLQNDPRAQFALGGDCNQLGVG
jgi:hypothetical protein